MLESRVVLPRRQTTRTPSTFLTSGIASDTTEVGGVSITTRSYFSPTARRTWRIRSDSIRSVGFGGIGPEASTDRLRVPPPLPATSTCSVAERRGGVPGGTWLGAV